MKKDLSFEELNTKIIESVGLKVDGGGNILTASGKNLTKDGLKIVIPTKANVNNMNEIVDDVIKPRHTLFNPYSEDELKRNQILVILMKYMSAISTSAVLEGVLRQLIELLSKDEVADTVSTHVKNFIIKLREVNGNRGVLMSKKRTSDMNKIVTYLLENNLYIIDYKLARGETVNGIKYNRIAKLNMAALDKLKEDYESIGIDEKTKNIFVAIIEFIIPNMEDKLVGSTSLRYPSTTAAISLYNEIQTRLNFLLEDMKEVLEAPYEVLTMPLLMDFDIDKYKNQIEFLPNQNQLDKKETTLAKNTIAGTLQDRLQEHGSIKQQEQMVINNSGNNIFANANNSNINAVQTPVEDDDGLASFKASVYGSNQDHGFINRNNSQVFNNAFNQNNVQPIANAFGNGFNTGGGFNQGGFNQGFSGFNNNNNNGMWS